MQGRQELLVGDLDRLLMKKQILVSGESSSEEEAQQGISVE